MFLNTDAQVEHNKFIRVREKRAIIAYTITPNMIMYELHDEDQ